MSIPEFINQSRNSELCSFDTNRLGQGVAYVVTTPKNDIRVSVELK
jgi:hypothetical protein